MNKDWISIQEAIPQEFETVIFCNEECTWVGWLEGHTFEEDLSWYACDEKEWIDNITHWMPIPDPYCEDE